MDSLFIGERVKKARSENGLTQYQLAEQSGISWQIIANIESGRTRVYVDHLCAIAEAVKKPLSWFFETLEDGES